MLSIPAFGVIASVHFYFSERGASMKTTVLTGLIVSILIATQQGRAQQATGYTVSLNQATQSLLTSAIALEDRLWNSDSKFLTYPEE